MDKTTALKIWQEVSDSTPINVALEQFATRIEKIEREACISIIEAYQVSVGNSGAGEMAAEWTMNALREIRGTIRLRSNVEVSGSARHLSRSPP